MDGKNFKFVRFWVILSSIFGILLVSIAAGLYFYYTAKVNQGDTSQAALQAKNIVISSYAQLTSTKIILFILLIWSLVKTLVCNIGLIHFAKNASDQEFLANKWSLAVLSLSIGGFFAPFMMTRLPNIQTNGTQNARITITKYFGASFCLSALATILGMFLLQNDIPSANRVWAANGQDIFYGVIGGMGGIALLAFITSAPFHSKNIVEQINTQQTGYKKYSIILTIYTVIATIELVLLLMASILRAFEAFARIGQNRGVMMFIAIMNALFQLVATMFLMYIIITVIKGLWNKDRPGYVAFQPYARYQTKHYQY